ncbi:hypothetical protein UA18_00461 [Burkholderia multivorans]|jgi:hypothetical protein|uniref:Uncharacterized protein n=1 Tax=Burkholderia multivorans TaxID=87883 RepID=A0ABD7L4A2_9BURK|nr:hypothetical protein DM42_1846 [Burkholderia cepacia]AIO76362.1 hypothetical protein DM80_1744 [Burkholderia multivorans]AJY18647.1 hypothetical protein NP80_89 [Burkholderia multivorans ATCC BAA-247]MDR8763622.1 hypothetical protein [Burkholderia multivorans]MDR8764934.1 hypothetical protein [Burkholderia multivorans]
MQLLISADLINRIHQADAPNVLARYLIVVSI